MKILTTVFDYPDKPYDYKTLHDVFVKSCNRHMPDVEVVTLKLQVPKASDDRKPGIWVNTVKLREISKYVQAADDDLIIADCDMLCTAPAYHAFDANFDIAYTEKPENHNTSCRINGGIILVKNTAAAKDWIKQLTIINDKMYYNHAFHDLWKKEWYGMNQAAMGYMITASKHRAKVTALPVEIWNSVDCSWDLFSDKTVFVHIKGPLRDCVFKREIYSDLKAIAENWYSYTNNQEYKKIEMTLQEAIAEKRKKMRTVVKYKPRHSRYIVYGQGR